MDYRQNISGNSCNVSISGKFTFSDHEKFHEIVILIQDEKIYSMTIDLEDVQFIDSAALGMLLIARDESGKSATNLFLYNPVGQVKKMFKVSKFDRLFTFL